MAEYNNTNDIDTRAAIKAGLVTDLNSSYVGKDQYSYARNAVRCSKEGDLGTLGNEPSNSLCYNTPYKVVGTIVLPDDNVLMFSGDGVNSEIGLGNPKDCTYTTLKNDPCLNFSQEHPITGKAKKDFQKGTIVTFTDKHNPVRRLELNKVSSVGCEDMLLWKLIDQPCMKVKKGQVGNMPNGVYSVAIAYTVDNQIFTDWMSITNRTMLYSETGSNSLEIEIDNLDTEFKYYSIVVVGNYVDPATNGATKLAKKVGTYSTRVKKIQVTDFTNPEYEIIQPSALVIRKNTWQKAGIISSNSNILVLADLVSRPEENYQLKAMGIKSEYVIEQVSADYYERDGQDIGYYGDEVYDYYIVGVYNTGEFTDRFHIPGPKPRTEDLGNISSADAYELDKQFSDCIPVDKVQRWMVQNTAGNMEAENNDFVCDRRIIGKGRMGFWQSTERYPDNVDMFGEDANTFIRYHKFPDECKVSRYSIISGKTYINIKGVRFSEIPAFDNPDIVGYKILRSDRKGGNGSVVARGIMTNVRSYKEDVTERTVMYSNYTVNDLNPDVFLSSTQTRYKGGSEERFTPLTEYHRDKFNFYSPHTSFDPKYSLGQEVKIEAEEIADITGNFQVVHNHPRLKLLNQFAFWLAVAIGTVETYFETKGLKNQIITTSSGGVSGSSRTSGSDGNGPINTSTNYDTDGAGPAGVKTDETSVTRSTPSVLAITGGAIVESFNAILSALKGGKNLTGLKEHLKVIKDVLKLLTNMGILASLTTLTIMRYANEVLNIINGFTGNTDYVFQYNAVARFTRSICMPDGNKRRRLKREYVYLPSDNVTIDDAEFRNFKRERSVYFELNKPVSDPKTEDNSRRTISSFGICDNPTQKVQSVGSAFYATSKVNNPNQYGSLGSAAPVSMHSCVLTGDTTPVLYGGDCIITKFHVQKRMQFFNQSLANTNYPAGVEYDYRLYRNIAYPRFWLDSTKYDFSEVLSKRVTNFTTFTRTTTSRHNLDCKRRNDGESPTRIDNAYMYLSNNCVLEFFVEADYNVDFREKTDKPFYSKKNTNLDLIFRSDNTEFEEEFKISRVYSDIYTTEISLLQQRHDFDPANPIPTNQSNSVIYSLPSFNLQEGDNWQYFLPANYFAFREMDFGELTAIHKLDQDRLIFLFSKSSPYVSMGRDFLELEQSGRKITIGDGGLFAQDPREIMPTDNNYGSCNSRYAFSNTHLGRFYPSERQGRILQFTESLDDVSRYGMSYWCKNYMPIQFYEHFPTYPQTENPLGGVGYLSVFDSFSETVYITKRDFVPLVKIDYVDGKFYSDGLPADLRDPRYFKDISWTLSMSPLEKAFVSFHDWHPDWVVQTDNHFMTVKDNGVYKHNERYDDFCNFYGKDYPFEWEPVSSSGQQVEVVRSLEYLLEVYKYKNFGRDRFHVLNENFDRLIVHNTEQISPVLNLTKVNPDPEENLKYPMKSSVNAVSWDVAFFKEENKYRVNQFWDSVKDRGEFTSAEWHLFPTDESGYKQVVNPMAININKPEEERKKFRHYWNKFRFIKSKSGPNKFIVKLLNIKKNISIR